MPWWSWVLIWVALLACSLAFLVLSGVYIVRKGLALMRGAGEALEALASRPAPAGEADDGVAPVGRVPGGAVFADPERMRREYDEGRELRRLARRDRRVARRRERGQAQSLADLGLN